MSKMQVRNCGSFDMEWKEFEPKGKIVGYSIIHVAPVEFKDLAPYAVCLIELEEGPRITAIYSGDLEKIDLGTSVTITFDQSLPRGKQMRVQLT